MADVRPTAAPLADERLVVFDGLCHLCTGWARFLQRHPSRPPFRLIPMQSDAGRGLMATHGFDPEDPLTFLVLDAGRCLTQSDATIHLLASAGGAWRLARVFRLIPRRLRDALYGLIARNRYRWFGRRRSCFVPQPAPPAGSAAVVTDAIHGTGRRDEPGTRDRRGI
jgi:predicted DCC family thiol-disulfide oxidoreductase YuxK